MASVITAQFGAWDNSTAGIELLEASEDAAQLRVGGLAITVCDPLGRDGTPVIISDDGDLAQQMNERLDRESRPGFEMVLCFLSEIATSVKRRKLDLKDPDEDEDEDMDEDDDEAYDCAPPPPPPPPTLPNPAPTCCRKTHLRAVRGLSFHVLSLSMRRSRGSHWKLAGRLPSFRKHPRWWRLTCRHYSGVRWTTTVSIANSSCGLTCCYLA